MSYTCPASLPVAYVESAVSILSTAGRDEAPADAIKAAAGDKPAAVRAAARSIGRAVTQLAQHGNSGPLRAAAQAAGSLGASNRVRVAFLAAMAAPVVSPDGVTLAAPWVVDLGKRGQPAALIDTREGAAKRGAPEYAQACGVAACAAFLASVAAAAEAAEAGKRARALTKPAPAADAAGGDPMNPAPAADASQPAPTVTRPIDAALTTLAQALAPLASDVGAIVAAIERAPGLPLAILADAIGRVLSARAADALAAEAAEAARTQAAAEAAGILADAEAAEAARADALAASQPAAIVAAILAEAGALPTGIPAADASPAPAAKPARKVRKPAKVAEPA